MASESEDEHAIRCAEWFVRRQGYTSSPVADLAVIVPERTELDRPANGLADKRRGRLAPRAIGIRRNFHHAAYVVAFETSDPEDSWALTVSMDESFGRMWVDDQIMWLSVIEQSESGWRSLEQGSESPEADSRADEERE